jgi:hypothetical protein
VLQLFPPGKDHCGMMSVRSNVGASRECTSRPAVDEE